MERETSTPKPNWAMLSGLRFLLAMVVVSAHMAPNGPIAFLRPFGAFAAVCGFLMVSGYSIRHSIEKQPEGYFARRALRIYPLYLVALLAAFLPFILGITLWHGKELSWMKAAPSASQVIGHILMMQGIAVHPIEGFAPSWTLAIECVLYLFAPLLMRCSRWHINALLLFSAAFFVLSYLMEVTPLSDEIGVFPLLSMAWFWLIGWQMHKGLKNWGEKAFCFLAPVAALILSPQAPAPFAALTVFVCVGLIFYQGNIPLPDKSKIVFSYLGELSYPLYLLHWPLFWALFVFGYAHLFMWFPVLAIALSIIAYHVIDKPLRGSTRRRLVPDRVADAIPLHCRQVVLEENPVALVNGS